MNFKALNFHHSQQTALCLLHLNICFTTEEATFTKLSFILSETLYMLLNYLGPFSNFYLYFLKSCWMAWSKAGSSFGFLLPVRNA